MKRPIPFVSTSVLQDLALGVVLIPLWYVLGIRLFIFHLLALLVFIKTILRRHADREKPSLPAENIFLLAFILVYGLSFLLNSKDMPLVRALASLNNLSFWVMGFCLIFAVYHAFPREDGRRLLRAFRIFGLISSLFVIFSLSSWILSHKYWKAESLLLMLAPERAVTVIQSSGATLLQSSLTLRFVRKDKLFGHEFPRPNGFDIYSNSLGVTMIYLLMMTLAYHRILKKRKGLAVFLALEGLAFLLSLSRIAMLAFPAAAVFVILGRKKIPHLKIVGGLAAALLIVLVLVSPQKMIRAASEFRKDSTASRVELYKITLSEALKKPVLGHGFKPQTEDFIMPIGSHSTYIGVLYRTGFLGFLIFGAFWLAVLRTWWRQRPRLAVNETLRHLWTFGGVAFLSGLIWMFAEDLDAQPVASFLFFIIIGLILSLEKVGKSAGDLR